jgi:hypothetical protein
MPPLTLRTLVGTIGLAIAIITTVSIPLGYFLVVYTSAADNLNFVASLNASQVGKFVLTDDTSWQRQTGRLAELVELPVGDDAPIRQRVYDRQGTLLLADGGPPSAPMLMRGMPIVVRGSTVGRIGRDQPACCAL